MKVIAMNNVPVKLWVDQLDAHAWEEVNNLTTLPFLFHHLALMPDAHGGKGMPIGGVLATKGVVIPNAVGVDIGCGMCAVKTNLLVEEIPQDVLRKEIMRGIRKRIPLGREHHKAAQDEQYANRFRYRENDSRKSPISIGTKTNRYIRWWQPLHRTATLQRRLPVDYAAQR